MRILMLGNSYTFYNDLPHLLADKLQAEVVQHTRGGAKLGEHLNPQTNMGNLTQTALAEEKWDYVILQESSNGPIRYKKAFLKNAKLLCDLIHKNEARPVFYVTWPYQKDYQKLVEMESSFAKMHKDLQAAYLEAVKDNNALIANVGQAFFTHPNLDSLYAEDQSHPSLEGSLLALETISQTIRAAQMT